MPTILMGWEYGGGLGHAARLLPIARALRERGHTVTFAMKNPNALATLTEADEFRSVTAPVARILKRNSGTPFQAGSYADILAVHGFNDEQCLFDTLQ